ncbi:MAG: threonylcarbamoyl-AMP synthase [Xanthomonadaceae bacterium]|nr:threonylcarbamoyl-AMP synthase [Xanthomonadaceae bacterium]
MHPKSPLAPPQLAEAVEALRRGELVGLPTETVYGLAADAANPEAVRRIFALKGRPADHPLIVHLGEAAQIDAWARDIPPAARTLAQRFWPGPLTLILRRARGVHDAVTGGQDTVGLRVPAHPVALALLKAFGGGLAAPSANRFGHVSPTTAQHVREEFGEALPVVLDGGPCPVGIESTIVDLSSGAPRVLRPGRIGVDQLEGALGIRLEAGAVAASPRVSGSHDSHYAPRTPAELVAGEALAARCAALAREGEVVLVIALGPLPADAQGLGLPAQPTEYARHLYAALRAMDTEGADRILVQAPPEGEAWAAVRDRLRRATAATDGMEDDAP